MKSPPPPWLLILAFSIIYTSWGTTYYGIKVGVQEEHLPPGLFGGIRIFVGGVVLISCQLIRRQSLRLTGKEFRSLALISFLLFVMGNGLITFGLKSVDSSYAAILTAVTPLLVGLCAQFWPGAERLTGRGWIGILVGMLGVMVLKNKNPLELLTQPVNLIVLGSSLSWAIGSLVSRNARVQTPHLTWAGYQMLFGGFVLTLIGFLLGEADQMPAISNRAIGAFFYLLIVGSLMGFVAFNWLLGYVSAAKVGTYAYVNPAIALFVGWIFGEEVGFQHLGGIAIILFAVFLVRGGERPSTTPAASAEPQQG